MVKSPSSESRRNGRADFLLVVADIRAALAAGHTLRRVFEEQRHRLSFGYIQFTRYVKRFITMADGTVLSRPPSAVSPLAARPVFPLASPATEPRRALPDKPQRFHFDPMSVDRKDLV